MATAVRLPSGEIAVHREEFVSASRRHRLLRLPVLRGGLTLIESLALGIKALNYSAGVAIESVDEGPTGPSADFEGSAGDRAVEPAADRPASPESGASTGRAERGEVPSHTGRAAKATPGHSSWKTNAALTGTMIVAFGIGIVVFFWVPMIISGILTDALGSESGVLFNVIDGIIRVVFFLAYIWGISRWKEMRRIFEYHGAEHRAIFTQEAGEELTPENARKYTTKHPRCGTSFLLIVMVVSIFVFMLFGKPATVGLRFARLLLIPVIAGVSYEIMKLSARRADRRWARWLAAPGVWLQNITTKEPSDDQVEVAIAALRAVRVDERDARESQVG